MICYDVEQLPTRVVAAKKEAVGSPCISFQAELRAIRLALEQLHGRNTQGKGPSRVAILTDSQSVLKALESGPPQATTETSHEIWELLAGMTNRTAVLLQYIPAHVGVPGNERADELAGEAARQQKGKRPPLSRHATKMAIGVALRRENPRPTDTVYFDPNAKKRIACRPPLAIPGTTRLGETTIRQLRTGRHPLVHGHAWGERTQSCPRCGGRATVTHILLRCKATTGEREQILPAGSTEHELLFERTGLVLEYLTRTGFLASPLADYIEQ